MHGETTDPRYRDPEAPKTLKIPAKHAQITLDPHLTFLDIKSKIRNTP